VLPCGERRSSCRDLPLRPAPEKNGPAGLPDETSPHGPGLPRPEVPGCARTTASFSGLLRRKYVQNPCHLRETVIPGGGPAFPRRRLGWDVCFDDYFRMMLDIFHIGRKMAIAMKRTKAPMIRVISGSISVVMFLMVYWISRS
jgi:hypothetical protein